MSETYRTVRPDELPALARMVAHSFPGRSEEYLVGALAAARGGLASILIGEYQDRPVSTCMLHAYRQRIGGVSFPMMGLGTVAVSPDYRRRRAAARLLTEALRRARERGDLVSALYPFRISFYQGLGYGLAGEALQYLIDPRLLPDAPERERVRLADPAADLPALRAVYDRWIGTQNGQLERDEAAWGRALKERSAFLYVSERGEPEGYALVRYRTDLPLTDRYLEVDERAWLNPAARRGIYAWLSALSDQWSRLVYRAHPEEGFGDVLREPRLPLGSAPHWVLWFPAATLLHGPMFRLLDVEEAWRRRVVSPEANLRLILEVRDEQLPENGGPWTLRLEDGRVTVEHGTQPGADCTLRGDVSWISRIFIGAVSPSAAAAAGGLEVEREGALPQLDAALRLPRPWMFDAF